MAIVKPENKILAINHFKMLMTHFICGSKSHTTVDYLDSDSVCTRHYQSYQSRFY